MDGRCIGKTMEVEIKKSFQKDVRKSKYKTKKLAEVIRHIINAKALSEINQIKKIEGYEGFYRIRVSDYRIGIEKFNNVIILHRYVSRGDFYKKFP